jgi:hypothetical protein
MLSEGFWRGKSSVSQSTLSNHRWSKDSSRMNLNKAELIGNLVTDPVEHEGHKARFSQIRKTSRK